MSAIGDNAEELLKFMQYNSELFDNDVYDCKDLQKVFGSGIQKAELDDWKGFMLFFSPRDDGKFDFMVASYMNSFLKEDDALELVSSFDNCITSYDIVAALDSIDRYEEIMLVEQIKSCLNDSVIKLELMNDPNSDLYYIAKCKYYENIIKQDKEQIWRLSYGVI